MPRTRSASPPLQLDLALQGGGAHGAFTWGVLDRLLQDETLEIAGVSGTSAGAMNAVALAAGLSAGGREGARASLRRFWLRVGEAAASLPQGNPWLAPALVPWLTPWWDAWQRALTPALGPLASPYWLNPLNLNPLRDILRDTIDFERVRSCRKTRLFIAATDVASGQLQLFRTHELDADRVLASACLPLLFQAVEVNGQAYWDGGYAGNPSLLPLVTESPADDLLLVQINPTRREATPTTAPQILDRLNEITFNASLLKELRSLALLQQLLVQQAAQGLADVALHCEQADTFSRVRRLRMHRLAADEALAGYGATTKLVASKPFLLDLHRRGHDAADAWLTAHRAHLGRRASFDLAALARV
jgi:NTE family protein